MRTVLDQPISQPKQSLPSSCANAEYRPASKRRPARQQQQHYERVAWQTVTKITVELTDYAVRVRFPAKPSEIERTYLKQVGAMRWTPNGNYWYAKRSPESQEFAARLEQSGFPFDTPKTPGESELIDTAVCI